jgi:hypothetical protein
VIIYEHRSFNWRFLPLKKGAVYIPYAMKVTGDYQLGDSYTLNFGDRELEFMIKGYIQLMGRGGYF